MTKHRASDARTGGDSITGGSGGGSSAGAPPAPPAAVTNVVQVLAEHLPTEYTALLIHIRKLDEQTVAADRYREQLERIAADAGITLPVPVT